MSKVFLYQRVSSEKQTDGTGLERQGERVLDYATTRNLMNRVDEPEPVVISDNGLSAFKGLHMSEGQLGVWFEQARAGRWNGSHLVVESIDRFSRENPFTVVRYLGELVDRNITIHDVSLGLEINRANSGMLGMVTMSAQRAYEESKIKSDRIRDGWKRKRENAFNNGTVVTNKRPQWIDVVDDKYVLNHKAAVIKEIFRLYQTGLGCPTIAKELQKKEGDEWKFDREWSGEHVYKILKNRRVTGSIFISEIIRNHDDVDNPVTQKKYLMDVYPVVISTEEFDLVQKLLTSRRPNAGRTKTKKSGDIVKSNIFSGIFRCYCGQAMFHNIVRTKREPVKSEIRIDEYRYIRCLVMRDGLCDNGAMDYDVVERLIVGRIRKMDFTSIVKPEEVNPEVEITRLKILEVKAHIEEFELGIQRIKNSGKKVSFTMLEELEESQNELAELEAKQESFDLGSIDLDVLKDFDPEELHNVKNVAIRSRFESELAKVVEKIELRRSENVYIATISYRSTDMIRHVLVMENLKKKGYHLRCDIQIIQEGDTIHYGCDSFVLSSVNGSMPRIGFYEDEPLNMIEYVTLQTVLEFERNSGIIVTWMRNQFNFLFGNS
jgi:DNA invertase Pin-like site-specific DNA recombinase